MSLSAIARWDASVQKGDALTPCYNDNSHSANVYVFTQALLSGRKIRNPFGDRVRYPLASTTCTAVFAIVTDGTSDCSSRVTRVRRGDVFLGGVLAGHEVVGRVRQKLNPKALWKRMVGRVWQR